MLPLVSIVIPAFNEERYIADTLRAIQRLNYPKDRLEIIVVDNGSVDRTVEIARTYTNKVFVHDKVRVGAVRNFGVQKSQGEYIAFIDSDCIPQPNWLIDALNFCKEKQLRVVGGVYLIRENASWVERAWVLNSKPKTSKTSSLVGGSIFIERKLFEAVGGFDERMSAGEDTALAQAIIGLGENVWFYEGCAVVHLGYPNKYQDFVRRQIWHASSYLASRKSNGLDLMFMATCTFLSAEIFAILMMFVDVRLSLIAIVILVALAGALSVKRVISSKVSSLTMPILVGVVLLDIGYLFGRSVGLMKSILSHYGITKNKKHYY